MCCRLDHIPTGCRQSLAFRPANLCFSGPSAKADAGCLQNLRGIQRKPERALIELHDRRHGACLDIDSHEFDAFDRDTVAQVEKVADWLAGAYARASEGGAARGPSA